MGFFSKLFDKMEQGAMADFEKKKAEAIREFEDEYFDNIDDFQSRIRDLIDDKIDIKKNEGKSPEDILAMFDSVIVKYAESKIWPFFDKKCEVGAVDAYRKFILDHIETEKQEFIEDRLDYYKDIYEKKEKR